MFWSVEYCFILYRYVNVWDKNLISLLFTFLQTESFEKGSYSSRTKPLLSEWPVLLMVINTILIEFASLRSGSIPLMTFCLPQENFWYCSEYHTFTKYPERLY